MPSDIVTLCVLCHELVHIIVTDKRATLKNGHIYLKTNYDTQYIIDLKKLIKERSINKSLIKKLFKTKNWTQVKMIFVSIGLLDKTRRPTQAALTIGAYDTKKCLWVYNNVKKYKELIKKQR